MNLHLNFHLVKKIEFRQLYEYIKSSREYEYAEMFVLLQKF